MLYCVGVPGGWVYQSVQVHGEDTRALAVYVAEADAQAVAADDPAGFVAEVHPAEILRFLSNGAVAYVRVVAADGEAATMDAKGFAAAMRDGVLG